MIDANEKKRRLKLKYSSVKSNWFLKFTGFAKHIRIIKLHRLHPRPQLQNDIFDLMIRYEMLFFFQF